MYVTSLTLVSLGAQRNDFELNRVSAKKRNISNEARNARLRARRGKRGDRRGGIGNSVLNSLRETNSLAIDQPRDWLMATERKKRTETTEMDCVTPTESA